ncbi:MAG TPA: DNA adenine methylase [Candidatus Saccharibacteria bacterium]|nr:DNA adenine methylase [Candidatus Saccharibacteria bacterium]
MNKAKAKKARPFVKWVGGKTQLLEQLVSLMPASYGAYFEPFLGGGALFFHLKPNKAYINDINQTLIHTYKIIKDSPEQLCIDLCQLGNEYLSLDHEGRKEYFYERRREFNTIKEPDSRKATLMIFLNKTCFNGMYRENAKGEFNVPFGDYKNPKICDTENLVAVNTLLKDVEPMSVSYIAAVKNAKKGDFVYFDPPYHPLSQTSNFTSYSLDSFSARDQEQLRDLFVELDKRGCYVMLSNSASDFIKDLYKDYRQELVLAGRSINSKATGRGKINELVVLNY